MDAYELAVLIRERERVCSSVSHLLRASVLVEQMRGERLSNNLLRLCFGHTNNNTNENTLRYTLQRCTTTTTTNKTVDLRGRSVIHRHNTDSISFMSKKGVLSFGSLRFPSLH